MKRCLDLAKNGLGNVAPNPMVGALLVHNDRIIGEGFHAEYGRAHAEVNAIVSVPDPELLKNSTIYVNLEPCSHFGKTPPCADLIIQRNIPKVVIAQLDPNPQVSGSGVEKLKDAGIEVLTGIMESEAKWLNRRFNTFYTKKRPYIILKWAESSDGFADISRTQKERGVNWISSPETQKLSHSWRTQESAILVGSKTVNNDNPSLTARAFHGKNPLRIVLEGLNAIHQDSIVLKDDNPTLIFNPLYSELKGSKEWIKIGPTKDLSEVLSDLFKRNIQSVIIEGGPTIHQAFYQSGLWDEIRIIKSRIRLGEGLRAAEVNESFSKSYSFGDDLIQIAYKA